MLRKSVDLFKHILNGSPNPELQHWDRWAKNCAKHPPSRERTENDEYISRIHFTFMTLSNRWIRQALYSGQATAELLPWAEHIITAVPETCYPRFPDGDAYKKNRAGFLTTHGGLLAVLAARAHFIAPEGGQDLETYRDARSYLLRALALLRPLEEKERVQHLYTTVASAIEQHPVRREVMETKRYLQRAERALNVR